ncbi:hypothetical protein TRFO_40802 [Tritrichomonas foetus]|uniref:Uncharacterized protein n=1 Tax=Tritrichomonas foetus TaxID=1144522 RepID=A0A1J4IZR5_9EUKA|nr:hypothetical protein TRFO_40802 [Tritrichomonas foetus]|eukprot:OHS92894.1 hypothetical protein TRFO_40802 [Tritrichomonas foetus]
MFLGVNNKGTIKSQENKFHLERAVVGRSKILNDEYEIAIYQFISERYFSGIVTSYDDIYTFVYDNLGIDVSQPTIRRVISSCPSVKVMEGTSYNLSRLECDPDEIDNYYEIVAAEFGEIPAVFINVHDECGYQPFADAKRQKAIVVSNHETDTFEFPVDKSIKRTTFWTWVNGNGTTGPPFYAISRKTIK